MLTTSISFWEQFETVITYLNFVSGLQVNPSRVFIPLSLFNTFFSCQLHVTEENGGERFPSFFLKKKWMKEKYSFADNMLLLCTRHSWMSICFSTPAPLLASHPPALLPIMNDPEQLYCPLRLLLVVCLGMGSHRPLFLSYIITAPLFLPHPDFPVEMKWRSNWFSFLLLSSLFSVPESKIAWSQKVALLPPVWSHREKNKKKQKQGK